MKRARSRFPKGWDEKRVKALMNHYEKQSEDEAAAEDDAAYRCQRLTMMAVPVELVQQVKKFVATRAIESDF